MKTAHFVGLSSLRGYIGLLLWSLPCILLAPFFQSCHSHLPTPPLSSRTSRASLDYPLHLANFTGFLSQLTIFMREMRARAKFKGIVTRKDKRGLIGVFDHIDAPTKNRCMRSCLNLATTELIESSKFAVDSYNAVKLSFHSGLYSKPRKSFKHSAPITRQLHRTFFSIHRIPSSS